MEFCFQWRKWGRKNSGSQVHNGFHCKSIRWWPQSSGSERERERERERGGEWYSQTPRNSKEQTKLNIRKGNKHISLYVKQTDAIVKSTYTMLKETIFCDKIRKIYNRNVPYRHDFYYLHIRSGICILQFVVVFLFVAASQRCDFGVKSSVGSLWKCKDCSQ